MTPITSKAIVYDDATYHLGSSAFSIKKVDRRNAGTHIGMYLAWIICNRLESFSLRQKAPTEVEEVRSRQTSGRRFLYRHCLGRLTSEALANEANLFTAEYYEEQYLRDYEDVLVKRASGTYTVADTWANYDRLAVVVNKRFQKYRSAHPHAQT